VSLEGKVAIVTGGTKGIGRAIAESLLRAGSRVYICARDRNEIEAAVGELSSIGEAFGKVCDMRSEDQVRNMLASCNERLGGIDILVIDALVEPLLHLLKNAVVHGIEPPETRRLLGKPEKGRICVAVSMDADDLILSVRDDGRGISTTKLIEKAIAAGIIDEQTALGLDEFSAQSLVFEKGLTTAESLNLNAGRGIGMSIVKESVEARGGSMTVESEQQQGTKFTMRMPVTLAPVPAPDPEPEVTVEIPPLVLVVDDSASIRRMTAKIVEDAGLRAITAASGADALELLLNGEWEPDLILSDVEMPVMDGWAFLEYVKTDDNFGHIPVVMVTSLDAPQFKQKAFGLGASDYLVKPFSSAELERVCGSLLEPEPV